MTSPEFALTTLIRVTAMPGSASPSTVTEPMTVAVRSALPAKFTPLIDSSSSSVISMVGSNAYSTASHPEMVSV